jgi:hypothetical protein
MRGDSRPVDVTQVRPYIHNATESLLSEDRVCTLCLTLTVQERILPRKKDAENKRACHLEIADFMMAHNVQIKPNINHGKVVVARTLF